MKIELYNIGDGPGQLIKNFLENNNIPFKEIITNDINILNKVCQGSFSGKASLLKITKSHSISIIHGFLEWELKHLLEHIKKYNPKFEIS
jgi:hypothetical protein